MKNIWKSVCVWLFIGAMAAVPVVAENAAMVKTSSSVAEGNLTPPLGKARADGYFQNTRSVLLFSPRGANAYIGRRMEKELSAIFRYPYYQVVSDAAAASSDSFIGAAKASGADIVVLPIVVEFSQFRRPGSMFSDSDPLIWTSARLRLEWWETGMDVPAMAETRFFDCKEEGFDTDPDRIFDEMWKQLMKKFPYRRIPTDLAGKETKENREAAA